MSWIGALKTRINRSVTGNFLTKKYLFLLLRFLSMRGWELPFLDSQGFQNPWARYDASEYWRSRTGQTTHSPALYLEPDEWTAALLEDVLKVVDADASFLEVGCNAGRNLAYLFAKGFRQLAGIEINAPAIHEFLRQHHPDLHAAGTWHVGDAASQIRRLESDRFDVVFSLGVLIHIPPSDISLFQDMVRVSRRYIAIFTEEHGQPYPYDFERAFERCGCKLVLRRTFYGRDVKPTLPTELFDEREHRFREVFVRIFIKNAADRT